MGRVRQALVPAPEGPSRGGFTPASLAPHGGFTAVLYIAHRVSVLAVSPQQKSLGDEDATSGMGDRD